jgi:multisubunit Na+/H+ antiporter MnhC subunit
MGWIWLIVAIILLAAGLYVFGRFDFGDDTFGLFWCVILGSLLWPLVLTAIVIFGPFVGVYALGVRHRNKKEITMNK